MATQTLAEPNDVEEERAAILQKAKEVVGRFIDVESVVIDFVLAVILANKAPGDPVWAFLVGPPSSGKSELIRGLRGCPNVFTISAVTANTFASGWEDEKGREPSLLARLTEGTTLAIKDFGSIQALHPNTKAEVLQQLREIYDGAYHKRYGTGKVVDWAGRLGIIAGATPAIEKDHAALSELGERFISYRMPPNDRAATARQALKMQGQEEKMRAQISAVFNGVLQYQHNLAGIRLTKPDEDTLITLADVLTRLRSPVARDHYTRQVLYEPAPEGPPRMAKVLLKIVRAVASLRGHTEIQPEDLGLARRVVRDSTPSVRVRVLEALLTIGAAAEVNEVRDRINLPATTVRRTLEDLHQLDAVERAAGKPEKWWISEEQCAALVAAGFKLR